ncbi:hypothetical protein EJ08DRAFT_691429 [Tothia fuscella]|uniref:Uncharacterized protein n=1 Tax=Tothia fuscella TaxID=1048955 RepID=A0A9P4P5U7_9PEZI|nr:hypothetical protein EJ08DRAFT_691429 [Tothia fuscella]
MNAQIPGGGLGNSTRRTLSNATTSTASSGPSHQNSIRRSSSGRSTGPLPNSYVALLRKQKATVWCDRSQAEDPRIRIQQRLAKERAEREVVAGPNGMGRSTPPIASSAGGSFTGGVARKIRHHGGKPVQYTGGNMAGAGVPMRLSATEVEDEAPNQNSRTSKQEDDLSEWEKDPAWGYAGHRPPQHHHRSGSGRSSLGSQRRVGSNLGLHQPRFSTASASSTPTSGHSRSPSETHLQDLAEETPVPQGHSRYNNAAGGNNDYFAQSGGAGGSGGSGSSGASASERENSFGAAGALPMKTQEKEKESKDADDLIRRGSVDERTMTMGRGVRLFVANPDLSD